MQIKYQWLILVICILGWGCRPEPTDIPGFDEQAFAQDPYGCQGIRADQKDQLFEIGSYLKGLSEDEVAATLGKPDGQDLADRSQQFFIYFIDPADKCTQTSIAKPPLTMLIRFSALGIATEVNFQNY